MDREEIRRNQAQESVSVTEEVNEANPIDSTQEINPTIPSYVIDDTTISDSFDEEFLVSIEEEKQRLNSVIAGLQEKEMARHEQERREREAWLEKLRRENGLLSSDEEELKQEAAEETRRHTVFIESLDREKKNLIAAAARERRNPNRTMDIPQRKRRSGKSRSVNVTSDRCASERRPTRRKRRNKKRFDGNDRLLDNSCARRVCESRRRSRRSTKRKQLRDDK